MREEQEFGRRASWGDIARSTHVGAVNPMGGTVGSPSPVDSASGVSRERKEVKLNAGFGGRRNPK